MRPFLTLDPRLLLTRAVACLAALLLAAIAWAQDPVRTLNHAALTERAGDWPASTSMLRPLATNHVSGWAEGFSWPGVAGTAFAATWYHGDLIIGGDFEMIGGASIRMIARWDGVIWHTLGSGLVETDPTRRGGVADLLVSGDDLIVAGGFSHAGGSPARNIARWDGTAWHAMGEGFDKGALALIEHGGTIIAGGSFTASGVRPIERVARWDGTAWQPLPGGGVDHDVYALASNGDLFVGGQLGVAGGGAASHIARWDGTAWHALGPGLTGGIGGTVFALAIYGSDVIAGGSFSHAGALATPGIAAWNGSDWSSLGGIDNIVYALALHEGRLIAGGTFTHVAGQDLEGIAQWDGVNWTALPSRSGRVQPSEQPFVALTLASRDTALVVGGRFDMAPDAVAINLALWDGEGWWPFGWGLSDRYYLSYVSCFADHGGKQIIGGRLAHAQDGIEVSVDLRAFDGQRMEIFEWRVSANSTPEVTALLVHKNDLIAGGTFITMDGLPMNGIARWDGVAWHSLASGLNAPIEALAEFDGDLIAGGHFTEAGGQPATYIARWDGSAWHALGDPLDGLVATLAVHDGELIVGGQFGHAGAIAVHNVAAWNGARWRALGSGTNGLVRALASFDDDLVIGGYFTEAGGAPMSRIARWNGSGWSPLGDGFDDNVNKLVNFGADLVAGGRFLVAGGVPANMVARWNGVQWSPMDVGIQHGLGPFAPAVFALHVVGDRLLVGGHFLSAGGHTSDLLARWDSLRTTRPPPPGTPTFAFGAAVPNPFQGTTGFECSLAAPGPAKLEIFDMAGRRVATLIDGDLPAGPHTFHWNGRDAGGGTVPSGLYFARLTAGGTERAVKVARVQ